MTFHFYKIRSTLTHKKMLKVPCTAGRVASEYLYTLCIYLRGERWKIKKKKKLGEKNHYKKGDVGKNEWGEEINYYRKRKERMDRE